MVSRDDAARLQPGPSWFCRTAACQVVYFNAVTTLQKDRVAVRIGLKETDDPITLCYCFGYTLADVRTELAANGRSEVPLRISEAIRAKLCACTTRNPAGVCCLPDVHEAVAAASLGGQGGGGRS
jgi:hypothetical protein